jgi:2-methylaconitate cis-trans-isomerase PrpF
VFPATVLSPEKLAKMRKRPARAGVKVIPGNLSEPLNADVTVPKFLFVSSAKSHVESAGKSPRLAEVLENVQLLL